MRETDWLSPYCTALYCALVQQVFLCYVIACQLTIFSGAKMNLPYAVVQFPKEGTYSEIPTSWLTNNFTQCRWPITKNPTIFIKKSSPPEADWLLYDIKVECYCETFEKAQKQAEDANYATCEIRECGKRIIHEKQIDNTYTCNDNVDDDCDSSLQLCKVPQKKLKTDTSQDSFGKQSFCDKQLYKNQSSCEKVSQIAAEKSFSTSNHSLCNKSQTWIVNPLQASNIVDFDESVALESEIKVQNLDFISTTSPLAIIEKLIPICMETLKYVKSIDQRLKVLERNINMVEPNIVEPKDMFEESHLKLPINSIENLKRFEEDLENAETKANFIEFMKKIGGKDNKNMIQRCMNRLFTNEFGIACSWHGRRNNYRICDLKCINILKNMLRAKGVDECDFETKASDWFRHSKMRYERENKKSCMSVEEGLSPAPSSSASEADPLYIPSSSVQYTSEHNVEESTENDKASFIWSSKNVYLLLAKYEERMNEFASGAKSHSKIWEYIASDMNKVDPEITVSGTQCQLKMNNMKEIYKKIIDLNSISGNDQKSWQYFERMYELFGKSEWANPKATTSEVGPSSSANLTNENRNIKEVPVTEKSESEKLLNEFVKQMKQDMQEREKIKEERKLIVLQELKEQKEKLHKEKIDIMKKFCEAIAGKKLFD
ncbi:uncharacterized protein LOC105203730 isoform X2 [Solenopsis invicta]|uniref:uncharacterized protein LOC105203730 isoform X2 n=1 Tax=Solenopsis invicta TaxID=13686 RepID=UPI000E33DC37|nr:uncharacterized protein LOC105203730 isoform X2 [Solenopsis invicta]